MWHSPHAARGQGREGHCTGPQKAMAAVASILAFPAVCMHAAVAWLWEYPVWVPSSGGTSSKAILCQSSQIPLAMGISGWTLPQGRNQSLFCLTVDPGTCTLCW